MHLKWLIIGVLILQCALFCKSIKWLSLQRSHLKWAPGPPTEGGGRGIRSGTKSPCTIARRRYGLAKLQTKLCRGWMEAMPYVQAAAVLAAETCKTVFQDRRWNCSSIDTAPFLSPDLLRGTREQAYVYAISSAALTYTMARACAAGGLYHCACASPPRDPPHGNFKWGGCGDNVRWGTHFAKRFVDTVEKRVTKRSVAGGGYSGDTDELEDEKARGARFKGYIASMNLHNNKVGRKVIGESLTTQCKCHGVSGSCSIKTCWRAIPELKDVGHRLLRRFTNAKELATPEVPERRAYTELVYLNRSPDYCTRDETLGSRGTIGRKCNVTSNGTDSCRQLCCGRGYRTVVEERIERCQCKYYYCCYVKCKTCRTLTQRHECG